MQYLRYLTSTIILLLAGAAWGCNTRASSGGDNVNLGDAGGSGDDAGTGPTSLTYPVVDTAQDQCFSDTTCAETCPAAGADYFGQDVQYTAKQPAYLDNGDGTVTDLVTGLMWQQDPGATKLGYDAAVAGAASFSLAGYQDWRLPTIKELYSLMDFRGTDPSGYSGADTSGLVPFMDAEYFVFRYGDTSAGERIIDSQYVSATEYVHLTMAGDETVFGVNFADGRIKGYPKLMRGADKPFTVMYVRGPSGYGQNDLVDNGDGTVTDRATSLVWQQADSTAGLTWPDALAYCETLTLAGASDWRLPDAKELQSIVDYSRAPDITSSAAIDPVFSVSSITNEAGAADYPSYWSNTTHLNWTASPGQAAVYVAFGRAMGYMENAWLDVHGAGAQRSDPKVGDPADWPTGNGPQGDAIRIYNHARCVRSGTVSLNAAGSGAECTTGSSDVVDCASAAPGEPCCGDQSCVSPETEANCPADCADDPPGPTSCAVQAECEVTGACPSDASLGCSCTPIPTGGSACIPNCLLDQDCPDPPDMTLVCGPDDVCIPAGGP